MQLSKGLKWIAAVSLLAVGIPTAGIAFAAPAEQTKAPLPAAATEEISQIPLKIIKLDNRQPVQCLQTPAASQVKPALANNISAPVCSYYNYGNNQQCVRQASAQITQAKASSGSAVSTVCQNYNYKYNHSYNGPGSHMAGNYGQGGRHGRSGR